MSDGRSGDAENAILENMTWVENARLENARKTTV